MGDPHGRSGLRAGGATRDAARELPYGVAPRRRRARRAHGRVPGDLDRGLRLPDRRGGAASRSEAVRTADTGATRCASCCSTRPRMRRSNVRSTRLNRSPDPLLASVRWQISRTVEGVHESLDDIQLVDCREQYEWDAGRVDGRDPHPAERRSWPAPEPSPGPREAGRRDLPERQPERARHDDAAGAGVRGLQPRGRHGSLGRGGLRRSRRPTARPAASPDGRASAGRRARLPRPRRWSPRPPRRTREERERIRRVVGEPLRRPDASVADLLHPAPHDELAAHAVVVVHRRVQRVASVARGPRRPSGCGLGIAREEAVGDPRLTGWTRGAPSPRSVAWNHDLPSNRSRPNAASSGLCELELRPRRHPPPTLATMADVDAARRELEDALGPGRGALRPARAPPLRARRVDGRGRLRARGRSRVRPTTSWRASGSRPQHGLPIVPRGSGTGLAGAATPIGDALVVVTAKMTDILEVRPEDRLAWVEPGLPNLDLGDRAPTARVHVRARPVVAADVVDRRQREHERRRPALPRVRRHVRARARARRRAAGRDRRAPRLRGTRGGRLRPARRASSAPRERSGIVARVCVRLDARCRRPSARCCSDFAHGRGLRGHGVRRSSRAASCPRRSR